MTNKKQSEIEKIRAKIKGEEINMHEDESRLFKSMEENSFKMTKEEEILKELRELREKLDKLEEAKPYYPVPYYPYYPYEPYPNYPKPYPEVWYYTTC